MQGIPKGLTHRSLGITHEKHVPSLSNDEILRIEGGKEEEWHHKMKSMYPSLFQSLKEQRRQEDLCNKGRGKSVYLHPHSTLCLDTSLQGGILLGEPLDGRKSKVFSQIWASYAYLAKEGALGEASTAQRISHEFRREMRNFLKGALLSSTQLSALREERSEVYDGMGMEIHGNSITLG